MFEPVYFLYRSAFTNSSRYVAPSARAWDLRARRL